MLNLQKLQRVVFKLNFYIKIIIRGGDYFMQNLILYPLELRFKSNLKWEFKNISPIKFIYIISFLSSLSYKSNFNFFFFQISKLYIIIIFTDSYCVTLVISCILLDSKLSFSVYNNIFNNL